MRVTGADGEHWLQRRHPDFGALRDSLGRRSEELPVMPKRSLFRQRLSSGFRESRHARLRDIVAAAVKTDALAVIPGVREFLGLNAMTSEQAVTMEEFQRLLGLKELSFHDIMESDEESSDSQADEGLSPRSPMKRPPLAPLLASSEASTAASWTAGEAATSFDEGRPMRAPTRIFDVDCGEDDVPD